jgi:hypothetical protein
MRRRILFAVLLLPALSPAAGRAQTPQRAHTFEVGALLSTVDAGDAAGARARGVGGRVTYNVTEFFALDSEVSHFPEGPAGDFGRTQGLFGVKFGRKLANSPIGVFTKIRPGFVSLGGGFTPSAGGGRTKFAADVGGVLEYYLSPRVTFRVDAGQTFIRFGDAAITTAGGEQRRLGTTRNFQSSVGFAFRF